MEFFSGLAVGSFFCGVLANLVTDQVQLSPHDLSYLMRSDLLPKNHHIQLRIRRAFLRASVTQLARYEKALENEYGRGFHDDITRAFAARKALQWPCTRSRWTVVPLPDGFTNENTIDLALDLIKNPSTSEEGLRELSTALTEVAIEEIVSISSWSECPEKLRTQMQDSTEPWISTFSMWVAHYLKRDDDFRTIQDALRQRSIQLALSEQSREIAEIHRYSKNTVKRLEALEATIEKRPLGHALEDRLSLDVAILHSKVEEIVARAPFGRKDLGIAAAENVSTVFSELTEFFVGRTDILNDIDTFVDCRMEGRNNGLLIVTAPAGFGKSTVAAAWCLNASGLDRRDVAFHFCKAAAGANTTKPEEVTKNLLRQVSASYGRKPDLSDPHDSLTALLKDSPANKKQLVVWLDGIDEAQGDISCFLPQRLGDRVCVIVSGRAVKSEKPKFLRSWTETSLARSYEPPILSLERMSKADVDELFSALCDKNSIEAKAGFSDKIFSASDQGYALFAKLIAEDVVKSLSNRDSVSFGASPLSFKNYAAEQLELLRDSLETWSKYANMFELLTVLREGVPQTLLRDATNDRTLRLDTLPNELKRWLRVHIDPAGQSPDVVSFTHPMLALAFRESLGKSTELETLEQLTASLLKPISNINPYALRHLPHHFIELGRRDSAIQLLTDMEFVERRFSVLGPRAATDIMESDWRNAGYG